MSAHDVVAVAWIDAEDAEMLKAAGRTRTMLYCVSLGGGLPLYSQATVDEMQDRIDELEAQLFIANANAALPLFEVMHLEPCAFPTIRTNPTERTT